MRFLIVDKRRVEEARAFVAELGVKDVQVIAYSGEKPEESEAVRQLRHNVGSQVSFVGVVRQFKRFVLSELECVLGEDIKKSISESPQRLRAWLLPHGSTPDAAPVVAPSVAFASAVVEGGIIVASGALKQIDRVTERRYRFMNRSARALAELAALGGDAGDPLDQFFAERALNFASSGRVEVVYTVWRGVGRRTPRKTEWHLKEGDKTTPDDAARVYFDIYEGKILLLRCGPHPSENLTVDIVLT